MSKSKKNSSSNTEISTEFAVIRTGGKQHLVQKGDKIEVEKLSGEVGTAVTFDDVLLVSSASDTKLGTPVVNGAKVQAKILAQGRGPKLIIYKKKRTTGYTKRQGHRQSLTTITIESV